jgi:dye decolorizing peroxidase
VNGRTDAGHIFTAYAANLDTQFVPVQQTLADQDLLNIWTTPIGSAVFALPPGAPEGGWVGESLLA